MRNYSIFLILAIVLLTSCNPDDGPLPLTVDLVTSVKAYDLDNNGNSTDLRVDFIVENNLNVSEYRIMVIPANSSSSFKKDVAISISKNNYLVIDPVPFQTEYTESRLPLTLPDANGDLIINGVEYVIAILVVGTGNFQLSEFSRPLTLLNQGIYIGEYEGHWSGNNSGHTVVVAARLMLSASGGPNGYIGILEIELGIDDPTSIFTIFLNINGLSIEIIDIDDVFVNPLRDINWVDGISESCGMAIDLILDMNYTNTGSCPNPDRERNNQLLVFRQ